MSVRITIADGPLGEASLPGFPGAGAVVVFEGIVRALEDDRLLNALHYDTYEPMAQNMLRAIAEDLVQEHDLIALHASHSRGRVGIGECSFRLIVASAHRKQALAAMDAFIDRMKQDVPIWKRPIWPEHEQESG